MDSLSHAQKVERIADFLRSRPNTEPLSLHKQSVSHQVPKADDLRRKNEQLDISALNEILEIDPRGKTCTAEAGVTFVELISATLRHGLVPLVVPELKTISIGGAVSGCSVESRSFKVGGFHDTCLEYEVITARGDVLTCAPDHENSLLFQMMHGTFGTLGILSRLKFKLMPAKSFVRMRYEKHRSLADYQAAIWRHYQTQDVEFMDGIIHSLSELVLCVGEFADEAPYTNRYDWTKVYFQSTRERSEDYLTTPHYLFRYDHGVTNVHPRSWLGRLCFAPFFGSTQLLRLAEMFHRFLSRDKPTITLDVFVPFAKVAEFFSWYTKEFRHFPLWCVPYRCPRPYAWLSAERFPCRDERDKLFLDIAIYGMEQRGDRNYHKLMEEKLLELGGLKTLISHNYFSEEDFWKIWNRPNYEKLKQRTDPHNIFRGLYAKTCRAAMGYEAR